MTTSIPYGGAVSPRKRMETLPRRFFVTATYAGMQFRMVAQW